MRIAIDSNKGINLSSPTGMSVSSAIDSWRSAVIARFVFATLGWLTAARGQRGPTDMYLQICCINQIILKNLIIKYI